MSVACLGTHRVANGLEIRDGFERRNEMELQELDLFFVREGIECAGFETRECVVGWGEDSQVIVGVVELGFDLVDNLGVFEESYEGAESTGLVEDIGDVRWGRMGGLTRRGSNQGLVRCLCCRGLSLVVLMRWCMSR